jgi:hypothetical protein
MFESPKKKSWVTTHGYTRLQCVSRLFRSGKANAGGPLGIPEIAREDGLRNLPITYELF